jgi:hypothetical protein
MDVGQLFLWFCIAFVVSMLIVGLNMIGMMMSINNGSAKMPGVSVGIHVLCGIVANISALGALVTGIIWLVQYLKN